MKPIDVVNILDSDDHLQSDQKRLLLMHYSGGIISLHYELKMLFWLGTTLLVAGLGIWIKDQITHAVVILILSCGILGCFIYAQLKKRPFTMAQVESPGIIYAGIFILTSY